MTKHTVIVDGQTIDAGSPEAAKLISELAVQAANDNSILKQTHDAELAAKDREISDKRAELARVEKQVGDQQLLIRDLADIKLLCIDRFGVDPTGRTVLAMKRDALRRLPGGEKIADKSDAYIEVCFDMKVEEARGAAPDPFRDALRDGIAPALGGKEAADRAYKAMCDDLATAHLRRDN